MKWPLRRSRRTREAAAPLAPAHPPPAFDPGYDGSAELMALWSGPAKPRDAIGMLGQELLVRHVERGRRGLVLCATSAGAGVTFMTAQLALVFAHFGLSTLIVDANLHDPRMHELIVPSEPGEGLLQYLQSEDLTPSDIIRRDVAENLSVVYAGGSSASASELIESERLRDFIGSAMRDFDLTLVDTHGANRSMDSRWIAHLVGYALVLGRRDLSFVDDLDALVRELQEEDVEIVGTMLNGA